MQYGLYVATCDGEEWVAHCHTWMPFCQSVMEWTQLTAKSIILCRDLYCIHQMSDTTLIYNYAIYTVQNITVVILDTYIHHL